MSRITVPAHEAPYLPGPLEPTNHLRLLDFFFAYTPTFGMYNFKVQFMVSMQTDPMREHFYFSPLLHLVCLGIGSRYELGRISPNTWNSSQEYSQRGEVFTERARAMINSETESPSLGTIIALIFLSIYCFAMMNDQSASNYFAIAVFLVQDFRLHRKYDEQLRASGLEVDCELDITRRDVYGFMCDFSTFCFIARNIKTDTAYFIIPTMQVVGG